MKKTTIILFSFSLLLIVAGAVLCFIGTRTGDVFDNTVVSNEPIETDINENVKSIVVNLEEVTVNVYGNSDKARIETVNVDAKQIKSKSSTEFNISDKTSFFDLILDTVQNFTGLRNILFREQVNTGAKTVNIYITDDVDLTQLTVYATKGSVNIFNMDSNTTYTLEVEQISDKITLSGVNTGSQIHLTVGSGTLSIENTSATVINATVNDGSFHLTEGTDMGYAYDLTAAEGTVYVFGDDSQGTKENGNHKYTSEVPEGDYTSVIVKTDKGNIHIKEKAAQSGNAAEGEKVE